MQKRQATLLATVVVAALAAAAGAESDPDVLVLLDGNPPAAGTYAFPTAASTIVLDNGLIRFTFGRDDAAGGIVTGWTNVSITAQSIVVNGVELAHNLNGVAPRDPDRQHSFYIDAGGGSTRLVCSEVRVLRVTPDLAEVAFVDTTSTPLRHEHHLIMRRGKRGLYGYDILTAVANTSINEVRMNARWDRSIFDHAYNWERPAGQQPTYGYLATQTSVGDETWRVDENNDGGLAAGTVYSKYNWSLYHHENPMFGHFGHGFGAWLTPLGGITDKTSAAFYGVGPNHQDLAIHQDALILNYFGANHYGLPAYSISNGYRRLYGPWYTFVNVGDPSDAASLIADARATAEQEIAQSIPALPFIDDPLYPLARTTVSGRLAIADGRPADAFWALLSKQVTSELYTIHEPTYFVKTQPDGTFALPGIPAGTYSLYFFATKGPITDQFRQDGIAVAGSTLDLGTVTWAPIDHPTFLWQIGRADRTGGEFKLGNAPRAYELPTQVPGTLTYDVGSSWEPENWYYAQTNGGTWTVRFNLDRPYTGTAFVTVAASMTQGSSPTLAVNGSSTGITGAMPSGNDSTIARQANRSGRPRSTVRSFPASRLVVGTNTLTLTRGNGAAGGNGMGWDTLVLEIQEATPPPAAQLAATIIGTSGTPGASTWTLRVDNSGEGEANDVRLDGFTLTQAAGPAVTPLVTGRDPNLFPVPVAPRIPAGGSATVDVHLDFKDAPDFAQYDAVIPVSANGGRARATLTAAALYPYPDTTPPSFTSAPTDLAVEATSAAGAIATYDAVASDSRDGLRPVVFDPPSGSAFPFGPSTVAYSAADASGNTATGSFIVTVADTTPPLLIPPPAVHGVTGPGATTCSALVAVLGTPTATDACSEPTLTTAGIPAGNVFAVGTTSVTYTATDGAGNAATATQAVTVSDTTPPLLALLGPVAAQGECRAPYADPGATAFDACAGDLSAAIVVNGGVNTALPGRYVTRYFVADGAGNTASTSRLVDIRDSIAPVISSAAVSPNVLWPANHRLVPVQVTVAASDLCDPGVKCRILSVTSNEPVARHRGRDDDDECDDRGHDHHGDPDWIVTGDLGLRLRAQRNARGEGRVYTVTLGCTDASGNLTKRALQVVVPHDRRREDRDDDDRDRDHDRDHDHDGRRGR